MKQYHDLCRLIQRKGFHRNDRTGTGTTGVFGAQAKFDLSEGFPLLTTKKMFLKGIIHEMLWFLTGSTNIQYLKDNDVHIWDQWVDEKGELGRGYGAQWRDWRGPAKASPAGYMLSNRIDQIKTVIDRIKTKPDDRRLIVTAWNPAELDAVGLPPCHCFFQFNTHELTLEQRLKIAGLKSDLADHENLDHLDIPRRQLDLQLYQRSCDTFLGVPFNIASYALLLQMVAQVVGMKPGVFTHTYGDLHIYDNHKEQIAEQLSRECRPLPTLRIDNRGQDIFGFKYEDFHLESYNPHPAIKGDVSI